MLNIVACVCVSMLGQVVIVFLALIFDALAVVVHKTICVLELMCEIHVQVTL